MYLGGLSEGLQGAGQAAEQGYQDVMNRPTGQNAAFARALGKGESEADVSLLSGKDQNYLKFYEEAVNAPDEGISNNPMFRRLVNSAPDDMTFEEKERYAKKIMAHMNASISAAGAFAFDSVFGALGDRYIGSASMGKRRAGAALEGLAQETPTEFIQSGGEQLSQNLADRMTVEPDKSLLEDVGEQAVSGGISGGIMGFAMGGGFHRRTPAPKGPLTRGANLATDQLNGVASEKYPDTDDEGRPYRTIQPGDQVNPALEDHAPAWYADRVYPKGWLFDEENGDEWDGGSTVLGEETENAVTAPDGVPAGEDINYQPAEGGVAQVGQTAPETQREAEAEVAPGPSALDEAAHEAASSPYNDTAPPTDAQIAAGTYKKGHYNMHGLRISIENPAGSTRSGVDESTGERWSTDLSDHYGYIRGTIGRDKDHIDVFIPEGYMPASTDMVAVVDQIDSSTGNFDEHKIIMGAENLDEARQIYLRNYDNTGADRIGGITMVPVGQLKKWLQSNRTSRPFNKAVPLKAGGKKSGSKISADTRGPGDGATDSARSGQGATRNLERAVAGEPVDVPAAGMGMAAQPGNQGGASAAQVGYQDDAGAVGFSAPLRRQPGETLRQLMNRRRAARASVSKTAKSDKQTGLSRTGESQGAQTAQSQAQREPWQMTRQEFAGEIGIPSGKQAVKDQPESFYRNQANQNHERIVRQAVSEGRAVPTNVLAEYPDLQAARPSASKTAEAVLRLHDDIVNGTVAGNEKRSVSIRSVDDSEAKAIEKSTGIAGTSGYTHTIDSFGMRHSYKQHGDEKGEAKRGQQAISREDFARIEQIIASPDARENGGKTKQGRDVLRYRKRFNGTVIYVEEVRTGKKELAFLSMWKVPATTDALPVSLNPPTQTPEALRGSLPQGLDKNAGGMSGDGSSGALLQPSPAFHKGPSPSEKNIDQGGSGVNVERGVETRPLNDDPTIYNRFKTSAAGVLGGKKAVAVVALVDARARSAGMTPQQYANARQLTLEENSQAGTEQQRQQNKGAFDIGTWTRERKAIIHAFKSADISTLAHELAHLFRQDLAASGNQEMIRLAEEWAGVKPGAQWRPGQEEKFARAFERYLREGKAPTAGLARVFKDFKRWLTEIYRVIKGSDINVQLSPEIRRVFDTLLTEGQVPEGSLTKGRTDDRVESPTRRRRLRFLPDGSAVLYQPRPDAEFEATSRAYGGQEAYDRAKAAGRTNLNFRQWVQVRTPAFKKWFGDWELALNMKKAREFVDQVASGKRPANIVIGVVGGKEAGRIKQLTGINTKGRKYELIADDIAHALQSHGKSDRESARGQIPITTDDLKLLPFVLQGSTNITRGSIQGGRQSVRFEKKINGTLVVVEIVPSAGGSVQFKTAWKRPSETADAFPPSHTSKTDLSPPHSYNQTIQRMIEESKSSGVVDDTGEPLEVYHGTRGDFEAFDLTHAGRNTSSPGAGLGFFFTGDPNEARGYAGPGGVTRAFFAQIKNPRRMNSHDLPQFRSPEEAKAFAKRQQLSGYDGIILKDEGYFVAFEPTQIKSATANTGSFSSIDPRLLYQANSAATRAAYDARIDELMNGATANRQGTKVLDRADILDLLGYGDKPLRLVESAVGKRRDDGKVAHPGMTAGQWKKLPDWIENPIAAFQSDTVKGRITMVAPELVDGKPVLIVLNPNGSVGGLDVHVLVNAYEKDNPAGVPVMRWVREGKLLYLDENKSPAFGARSGLQLPRGVRQLRGYNQRVKTGADLVKYRVERGELTQPTRGEFSDDSGLLFQGPVWSSRLKAIIDEKGGKSLPAMQWRVVLNQWKKKGTLPAPVQEELEWSGLEEYLRGLGKQKVSKAEMLDYLDNNGVHVGEVVKGESLTHDDLKWTKRGRIHEPSSEINVGRIEEMQNRVFVYHRPGGTTDNFKTLQQAQDALLEVAKRYGIGSAKFAQYQLPDGDNYREMLITLPPSRSLPDGYRIEPNQGAASNAKRFIVVGPDGQRYGSGDTEAEALDKYLAHHAAGDGSLQFKSSHFDEQNILAHVRFGDLVLVHGQKAVVDAHGIGAGQMAQSGERSPGDEDEPECIRSGPEQVVEDEQTGGMRQQALEIVEDQEEIIRETAAEVGEEAIEPFRHIVGQSGSRVLRQAGMAWRK